MAWRVAVAGVDRDDLDPGANLDRQRPKPALDGAPVTRATSTCAAPSTTRSASRAWKRAVTR
jgi:hypothetical protein